MRLFKRLSRDNSIQTGQATAGQKQKQEAEEAKQKQIQKAKNDRRRRRPSLFSSKRPPPLNHNDDNSSFNDESLYTMGEFAPKSISGYVSEDHTALSHEIQRARMAASWQQQQRTPHSVGLSSVKMSKSPHGKRPRAKQISHENEDRCHVCCVPSFSQPEEEEEDDKNSDPGCVPSVWPTAPTTTTTSPSSKALSLEAVPAHGDGARVLALKEGMRPTISMEERLQQMERNRDFSTKRPGRVVSDEEDALFVDKRSLGSLDREEALYSLTFADLPDDDDDDNGSPGLNPHDQDDDLSSVDYDLGSRINVSDTALMRRGEAGALRLTESGLKRHDEVALEATVRTSRNDRRRMSGYEQWVLQQDKKRWYQSKHAQRDEELHAKGSKKRRSVWKREKGRPRKPPPPNMGPLQKLGLVSVAKERRRQRTEVGNVSLAPIDLETTFVTSSPRSPLAFCRKKPLAELKEEFLEKERQRQREYQSEKQETEQEELERIQQKRRAYLEEQRRLESQPKQHPKSPTRRRSNNNKTTAASVALHRRDTVQGDSADSTGNRPVVSKEVPQDVCLTRVGSGAEETFSVTTTASSMPCAVCSKGLRTHIALPCMHYCFCEDCATGPLQSSTHCPVCQVSGVAYTRVFF